MPLLTVRTQHASAARACSRLRLITAPSCCLPLRHPETYDDAILESGNRQSKDEKRILFWTGATSRVSTSSQPRMSGDDTVTQRRQQVAADGTVTGEITVTKRANVDHVVQGHVNKHLRQHFGERREKKTAKAAAVEVATKAAKAQQREVKREGVRAKIEKLDAAVHE